MEIAMAFKMQKIKLPADTDLRMRTCYHEAGHAVMYHQWGYIPESIEVSDVGEGIVYCKMTLPTAYLSAESYISNPEGTRQKINEEMEKYSMICLSGYCAELKYLKVSLGDKLLAVEGENEDTDTGRLRQQMKKADEIIGKGFLGGFLFYLYQTTTRRIVGRPAFWSAVTELAEKLYKSKTNSLSGKAAIQIIDKHLPFGRLAKKYYSKKRPTKQPTEEGRK